MASLLMVPDLIRFLEELSWLDQDSSNLEEIAIDTLPKKTSIGRFRIWRSAKIPTVMRWASEMPKDN